MDEIKFYQMTPKQHDAARARFLNAGDNDGYWYLIDSSGAIVSRNTVKPWLITTATPATPSSDSVVVRYDLAAAAPEMYEILKALIVDDKWGVSMRFSLEAARRAAELLRQLEDTP